MKSIHISGQSIKDYRERKKLKRAELLEKRRNSEMYKKLQPVYQVMNRISLLLHVLLAAGINLVIEAFSRHSLGQAWEYMIQSPWTFLYNTYVIFITFLFVYLIKKRVFARILISVLWLALGFANGYMLSVRVTPFNAQDLKVAGDAVTLIDKYFTGLEGITLIVGIVAVICGVIFIWRYGGRYEGKMHRVIVIATVIVTFGSIGVVTDYAIKERVLSNYFGNIAFAYQDYGFPYCFSASLFNTGISQPSNYSEDAIKKISHNGAITENITGRTEMPNIIFIQLESFFDTNEAEFFTTSQDPIPNFRKIMENYSSGYFKVPSIGAGTANTEFEVLTGMNLRYFGPGEYPYKTVLKYQETESAATALKEFGYGAHALHNNGGNFYSRADVFNNIGFDSYTSKEFMNILQFTEKGWSKDDILLEHILNAMDSTEQQDFVFGITVQGHGEYPEEPILVNPRIKVLGIEDEGRTNAWEYYVNQLYETDKFVGDLIGALEQRGEPTVLVLYGDHLPTMGLEAKDLKNRYLYNTNYVIWDNIGFEKKDRNIPSYQIMAEVFERLDIHSGTIFNYHQERRKTKNYLQDLELLQYDILYGKQYVYEGRDNNLFDDGEMQMGILDVILEDLVHNPNDTYSLYGDNFTAYSRVFINGEKQQSTFLNNKRIDLLESQVQEGDIIEVSQVGSSNRIFRTSKAYIYQEGQLTEAPEDYEKAVDEASTDTTTQEDSQGGTQE